MDLTSVLGSMLAGTNGNTGVQSSDMMGNILKELASNKGAEIFGSLLKNAAAGSSQASATSGAKAGDILGSVLKNITQANAAQGQNGNVLGAILGQAGQGKNLGNMSATDILGMAMKASTVLNTILGKK